MRSLSLAWLAALLLACGSKPTAPTGPTAPTDTVDAVDAGVAIDPPADPPADPTAPVDADHAYVSHGCGGPEFETGLHQLCGTGHAACAQGTTCTTTTRNPCAPAPGEGHMACAACGAEIQLCL